MTTAPVSDLNYRNQEVRVKTERAHANPGPYKQLRTPPESDEKYRYYREPASVSARHSSQRGTDREYQEYA